MKPRSQYATRKHWWNVVRYVTSSRQAHVEALAWWFRMSAVVGIPSGLLHVDVAPEEAQENGAEPNQIERRDVTQPGLGQSWDSVSWRRWRCSTKSKHGDIESWAALCLKLPAIVVLPFTATPIMIWWSQSSNWRTCLSILTYSSGTCKLQPERLPPLLNLDCHCRVSVLTPLIHQLFPCLACELISM